MEDNILYIVLGIVFLVVRYLMSSSKNKSKNKNKPLVTKKKAPVSKKQAPKKKQQSIDEIFSEFVKELENKQSPKQAPVVKKKPKPVTNVDWQQVERGKIKPKQQLIDHEDYHYENHRIDASHKPMEAATVKAEDTYKFDLEAVNWQDAIIAKEILDRKYV